MAVELVVVQFGPGPRVSSCERLFESFGLGRVVSWQPHCFDYRPDYVCQRAKPIN